jgi:hypothetical protein
MPRTVPGQIAAKIGNAAISGVNLSWLVEMHLPAPVGNVYFSTAGQVNYGGNLYTPRVMDISGLEAPLIDRKNRNFGKVSIKFSTLAADGSSNFVFQGYDAQVNFEDSLIKIHLYDGDAGTAVDSFWWGHLGKPSFDATAGTCDISATFPWDSVDLKVPVRKPQRRCQNAFINETPTGADSAGCPYSAFGTPGFATCGKTVVNDCIPRGMTNFFAGWTQVGLDTAKNSVNQIRQQSAIQLVWGAGSFKCRPLIYLVRVVENELWVNFIVSGTNIGLPFNQADLASVTLFGEVTHATAVTFLPGAWNNPSPANQSQFPDGLGHSGVAHCFASFAITSEMKTQIANMTSDAIRLQMANGRPLISTGLPSQNSVLILQDLLQDPLNGVGLPAAAFDAAAVASAAAYVAGRYQARVVLDTQTAILDVVQAMLADFHGFITFNSGLIQLRCKRNDEVAVATFGDGGRPVMGFAPNTNELDASQVVNQVTVNYRKQNYHADQVVYYDGGAQQRAGHGVQKPVDYTRDSPGLFDDNQVNINAAITLREEQNLNLFGSIDVSLMHGLDVAPGDVIRLNSRWVPNNASNYLFRVGPQQIDAGNFKMTMPLMVYKPAVYADNADPFGADPLRTTNDTSVQGRPPDVTPVNLALVDVVVNDTAGKLATLRATFTYPVVDLTTEQANGIYREYPIAEVHLMWAYNDEAVTEARLGKIIKYPATQGDFQVDFYKTRQVVCWFVAVGFNLYRAPLGYIADPTKVVSLSANLSQTGAAATTNESPTTNGFTSSAYVKIESEICQLTAGALGGNALNFVTDGAGNRLAQFSTGSIAHPKGTQIAVAKQSYPSLTVNLNPARLSYPVVQNAQALPRAEGVRIVWDSLAVDNLGNYLVYWSTDADAGTNTAKLGAANPAWYATDPETPPAGVNLNKTGHVHVVIGQEFIGPLSTTLYVRVAATSGKRNYSSALSALANNKGLGAGAAPSLAPSTPSAGDVISNVPPTDTAAGDVTVQLRVWASNSDHTKSFQDAGAQWFGNVLQLAGAAKPSKFNFTPKDLTVTNDINAIPLGLGDVYSWVDNYNANGAGKLFSADAAVQIVVGGYSLDPSTLASVAISVFRINAHHSLVILGWTQGPIAVLLKAAWFELLVPAPWGDGQFDIAAPKQHLLNDKANFTPNAFSQINLRMPHPAGASGMQVRATLVAVNGLSRTVVANLSMQGDTTGDNSAPNWIAGALQATEAQAGLTVQPTPKGTKLIWIAPQHLAGTVDAVPQSIQQYGVKISDGNGAIWINPDSKTSPYPTQNSDATAYESLITKTKEAFGWMQTDLPPQFLANGFKFAVRGYGLVNGVLTAGPFSQYSSKYTVSGDPIGDSTVPAQPPIPVLEEYGGRMLVRTSLPAANSGGRVVRNWQCCMTDGTIPTTADPPTAPGSSLFGLKQDPGGKFHFTLPGIKPQNSINCFFVRCSNSSFPTSGGPGNNGWGPWSVGTFMNNNGTQSIVSIPLGSAAPVLATTTDPNAAKGYASVANVQNGTPISPNTAEPARVWFNSDTGQVSIEPIMPIDANAFSIDAIWYEFWKCNGGVLRDTKAINPALQTVIVLQPFQSSLGAFRYWLQNKFRDPAGLTQTAAQQGQSPKTNFMLVPDSNNGAGTPLYAPGANPPPAFDFHQLTARPNPYVGIL